MQPSLQKEEYPPTMDMYVLPRLDSYSNQLSSILKYKYGFEKGAGRNPGL